MYLFSFFSIKRTHLIIIIYHFDNYLIIILIIFQRYNENPNILQKFIFFYYHFDNFQKIYYNYIKRKNYTGV